MIPEGLKPVRALLPALALLLATASPASAQLLIDTLREAPATLAAEETGEVYRDWKLDCGSGEAAECQMSPINAAYEGTEGVRRLFGRMIEVPGQQSPVPVFVIEIALDYLLPEGVKLEVDNRELGTLAFRSCHAGGCLVPFRLDSQLLRAFRNGYTAELTLTTLGGETETVAISLMGFTRTYRALDEHS